MSKKKKILLIVVSIIFLFLMIGTVVVMIHVKNTDAIVLNDDLTCNYREVVYADRFIKELDGKLLDQYLVDTSVVGKRQIEVQYKNRYGFVEHKRFEIVVKDVVAPTIVVKDPYTIVEGEVSNLLDTIFCADDYDDGIRCTITGEYDLNTVGNYNLNIEAEDKSGNVSEKDFTLKVVKKEKNNSSFSSNKYTSFKDVYQQYKNENTEIGLDISKWQGDVDYAKIAAEGVSFVMLKVGGQVEIGGEYIVDPKFEQNINAALENGLKVGVYFYSYAKSESDAIKQARWVIQMIKKYNVTLPIAFDWENWNRYSTFGIGFRTLNKVAHAFINEVNRYNYEGVLYSSKYYLENYWYQEEYDNWLAYYTNNNNYQGEYMMWQLCSDGKINGINGAVDIDVLKVK